MVTSGIGFFATEGANLIILEVNPLHNVIHLAIGGALLYAGLKSTAMARTVNTGVDAVYLLSHLAALLLTLMIVASGPWQRGAGSGEWTTTAWRPPLPARASCWSPLSPVPLLVAGIATPGLAASTAGQFAVPHGQHGGPAMPAGHHQR